MSAPPFPSVLVANRGEIACRIFRTARTMGMRTVAVYSDADAKAKHVREADVAVHIGASAAAESYLRGDKILAAAKETGAAAIHPGYGFLSENPEFAEAVIAAGLIWIGPTPAAIRAMGLKDEAKRIAIAAGVPVLAGYQGEDQSEKRLLDEAKAIGFPVLIKAVAGGGGRGIREVGAAKDFKDQLASARREAKAAFGDDRVLIEKLVQRPRHIEVQVFGDKHGNLVHLYERDCSLQRRRQKVIEEAPAPGMTAEVRAAMTDAALKVARAVEYENAGTVEFIVDGEGPLRADGFWFLEMNTRLQVEHPVTEAVTETDLAEWQFRVAAGERLPKAQSEIFLIGHAIEARICAEDPSEGFRPSVGTLSRCRWPGDYPRSRGHVSELRVDAGFEERDAVPSAYDSLLGKIIVWTIDGSPAEHLDWERDNREDAIQMLAKELDDFEALGCATNAHFLSKCLTEMGAFAAGEAHVGWIAENLERLTDLSQDRIRAAVRLVQHQLQDDESLSSWSQRDGWRLNAEPQRLWRFDEGGRRLEVRRLDGGRCAVDGEIVARARERRRRRGTIIQQRSTWTVFERAQPFVFEPPGAAADHAGLDAGDDIHAPLPGKIVALATRVGAQVKQGDALVTLEAMKMEHALKAPRDGVVAEVAVAEGAQVAEGAVLVRLEPEEAA